MDFIIDNLVWFIAGGVVILMTIIGYFAEKTDFGKNLSTTNEDDVNEKVIKKEKAKSFKKEKKLKKQKTDEEIPQNQPLEEEFVTELPINVFSENPIITGQQNIEPVENVPVDIDENNDVVVELNTQPFLQEPLQTEVVEDNNIESDFNAVPIVQEVAPVDLQSAALEDKNIKIQPFLEAEPITPVFQESVTEIPTMENVVPDQLPAAPEEGDTNFPIKSMNIDEVPEISPIVEDGNSSLIIDSTPIIEEKPVIITDESIIPFDSFSTTMEMPTIKVEQGIPSVNMELPNLETIVQDNVQSDEEDIWKF